MKLELRLTTHQRGYAHYTKGTTIIFLGSINTLLPLFNTVYVPFRNIEEMLEELIIHELIHTITGIHKDKIIDGWHQLLCRLVSGIAKCNCPIDCFWRDTYA